MHVDIVQEFLLLVEPIPRRSPMGPAVGLHVQGYLAHKKTPLPYDHHRALGIGLP